MNNQEYEDEVDDTLNMYEGKTIKISKGYEEKVN